MAKLYDPTPCNLADPDVEPTDAQLRFIMREATRSAVRRAKESNKQFWAGIQAEIKEKLRGAK